MGVPWKILVPATPYTYTHLGEGAPIGVLVVGSGLYLCGPTSSFRSSV